MANASRDLQPLGHLLRRHPFTDRHEHRVRGGGRLDRARADRPNGSVRRSSKIRGRRHQQVHVPRELQMLEPVVEQVHRAAEPRLGQAPGQIARRRDQHGGARERLREHERLVAGVGQVRSDCRAVAHHDHAVGGLLSRVPAAQNGRPLPHLEQQARQRRHDRRLAAAAGGQVAHADRPGRAGGAARPAAAHSSRRRARANSL